MNKYSSRMILILTLGVFGILNTEMGIVGILPMIAEQYNVSIATAGWLVSGFALVVACLLYTSRTGDSVSREMVL